MVKRDSTTKEAMTSESGNWNVASDYAKKKIMGPLIMCDYYGDIAKFGSNSIIEELVNYSIPDNYIRYTGLKRLIEELLKLCKNSKFAMKKPKTLKELEDLEDKLKDAKKILPLLMDIKNNVLTKSKDIKLTDKFEEVLDLVLETMAKINMPLNKNHLIFTDKEEFNPHEFKKNLKHRMVNSG